MTNHWKICSTKENNRPKQPDYVNAIQILRLSSSQVHYGLLEAAALVYEDHYPITAVTNSKTLNTWYHRMNPKNDPTRSTAKTDVLPEDLSQMRLQGSVSKSVSDAETSRGSGRN